MSDLIIDNPEDLDWVKEEALLRTEKVQVYECWAYYNEGKLTYTIEATVTWRNGKGYRCGGYGS